MLLSINWDGFSRHWYEKARHVGKGTPSLDRMVALGASLENHTCGIPAITNPMQQTLVSGAWPDKTGNCYAYYDKKTNKVIQTGRLNQCENIAEAALRQGLTCASVHGWYFENRGCVPGEACNPYIQNSLPNFETRVELLLSYLRGEPVPSGDALITMQKRPDFLALYADDIDTVCHNGERLPYPELVRARTLDEWYANLIYTVQRMDKALEKLMEMPDTTIALAADHGGMPFGTPAFGVSKEEALMPRVAELLKAIKNAEIDAYVLQSSEDTVPVDAQAVLLILGTQAQLYYLKEHNEETRSSVLEHIRSLSFIDRCLDKEEQKAYGAWESFCDVYAVTRAPYFFGNVELDDFVGGSHAGMEDSIMHVFCAFYGKGIKKGIRIRHKTDLTQFAPTLCRLLNISGPADASGQVLDEILEEN